jgi:O-antigen/teichoic acid export membrane protein
MERSKRFVSALSSGYASVVALAVLNLVSIPFALATLGKNGFGVAATVLQIVTFSQVLQLGVGNSLARFFVDRRNNDQEVASLLKTAFLIGGCQASILLAIALTASPSIAALFRIPGEYAEVFESVISLSLAAAAVGFVFNPVQQLLYASQRIDLINYIAIGAQTLGTVVLICALWAGCGIVSYAMSAWTVALFIPAVAWFIAKKLSILPPMRGIAPDFAVLPALARFSGNIMMASVGLQLIALAPALVINRTLGVTYMGDWTVGTKLLQFATQISSRISNAAEPTLWQIFSQGDRLRCRQRLIETSQLTVTVSTIIGALLVALNGNFVALWSGGRVGWPVINDLLGSAILWVAAFAVAWCMLPGITKRLGNLKFIYLSEGALIMSLLLVANLVNSLSDVLIGILCALMLVRFTYGIARMSKDLNEHASKLLVSLLRPMACWVALMSVAVGIRIQLASNTSWFVFLFAAAAGAVVFTASAYTFILPQELKQQSKKILQRASLTRASRL